MNIEQIARISGVSRSTVSRVINNDPRVHEATRQRVQDIIRQYHYQPNLAARRLAGGRTHILGLVIPMGVTRLFNDPFLMSLTQSVALGCNQLNHSLMMWLAEPDYERRMIRQVLSNKFMDGVIVASSLIDDPLLEALTAEHVPFVLVGRHHTQISYVDVDNQASAAKTVRYLYQLEYRRIAAICGPRNMIAGMDRLKGYQTGLKQCGIEYKPELVAEGDFSEASGYLAAQQLLPFRPQAIFAASDAMAIGALRALKESGLRVPEDIAVVGFDDTQYASITTPPLTTVRQPVDRMGYTAVKTLIDLVENPSLPPQRVILPTELIIRATCCPAHG